MFARLHSAFWYYWHLLVTHSKLLDIFRLDFLRSHSSWVSFGLLDLLSSPSYGSLCFHSSFFGLFILNGIPLSRTRLGPVSYLSFAQVCSDSAQWVGISSVAAAVWEAVRPAGLPDSRIAVSSSRNTHLLRFMITWMLLSP